MDIKECIRWLEHFKRYWNRFNINPDCLIASDKDNLDKIDEIIKMLKILEELKKSISPGGVIEYQYYTNEDLPDLRGVRFIRKYLDELEEKYFPKPQTVIYRITIPDRNNAEDFKGEIAEFLRRHKEIIWGYSEDN